MEESNLPLPASTNTRWEKFTRALLATTCLSVVAGGSASADTILIVEGTGPAPADFPNTGPGYLLPAGTNLVQGALNAGSGDNDDYFEFQGLFAGHNYTLLAQYTPLGQERQARINVYDSNLSQIGFTSLEGEGGQVSGTIPGNGDIIVDINFAAQGNPSYQVGLTAELAVAPEPSTFATTGLAIAGALAWRRKRSAKA